jgi:cytochrome o ubiquinol oxidase operon protein cyoD
MAHELHAAHAGHHPDDHGHSHGHGHDSDDDGGADYHASTGGYAKGFLLAVVLTLIPFWLVMAKVLPTPAITAAVVLAFAAVQVVVHMVYFLHLNAKIEQGWSLLALIFTGILVFIMLSGSIWVMAHMNANMMPVHSMSNP